MRPRCGYTLIEVLLVLVILAILAGLAWPNVVRFSGEQSIKDAGERVRSELDRTRFRAIDTGLLYQFRYEPNGRKFLAVPAERDTPPVAAGTGLATAATLPVMSGEIGEGMTFQAALGVLPAGEPLSIEMLAGLPNALLFQQARWSAPILYQPDGTAATVTFRVTDDESRFIELSVRDLTGMATAGPLRKETGKWE